MAAKRTAETKNCCWDGIYGLCRGLIVNSSLGERVLGKKSFAAGKQGFNLSEGTGN